MSAYNAYQANTRNSVPIPPTMTPDRLREIASMMRRLTHADNGDARDLERWASYLEPPYEADGGPGR